MNYYILYGGSWRVLPQSGELTARFVLTPNNRNLVLSFRLIKKLKK